MNPVNGDPAMNTFVSSITPHNLSGKTTTTNGMVARNSSKDPVMDLFYSWGASRNLTTDQRLTAFMQAYNHNPDLAIRLLLWGRDVREGAGERNYFREVYQQLAITNYSLATQLMPKVAELGRADDLFVLLGTPAEHEMLTFYCNQLRSGNGLFFKWAPREKSAQRSIALKLRRHLNMSSRIYRKFLSANTSVVETSMCAKQYSAINYSHVPSRASAIYSKAFNRNDTERYQQYLADLTKPESTAKINAGAIFPYDVIKGWRRASVPEQQRIIAQWDALPNWTNDVNVLPMIDTSGSMDTPAGKSSVSCLDVAVSLGMYMASKSTGAFRDVFMEFPDQSHLHHVPGDILTKLRSLKSIVANTNLEAAFVNLLSFATKYNVPAADMPAVIMIFSDMQFDQASRKDWTANKMIRKHYEAAGYTMPSIVYWNLNHHGNVPVSAHKTGAALVSGFSPALAKSILTSVGDMTPAGIMYKTLTNPRYNY